MSSNKEIINEQSVYDMTQRVKLFLCLNALPNYHLILKSIVHVQYVQ